MSKWSTLCTYNISKIMQLGVCSVMIRHKNKLCSFFVVPGGGLSLLGMPDIEILGILSVQFSTTEPSGPIREIHLQRI